MDLSLSNPLPLAMSAAWIRPLWIPLVGAIAAAILLFLAMLLLKLLLPKMQAIAWTTAKEAVSQPLFFVVLAVGVILLLLIFPFLPYNTFGEDVKVVKETGLTAIMVLSIMLALYTASVSIAEELEGRTALTLLSKPVGRREFIVGKFLGINAATALLFIVLGALFLASVSFKVVYDARESAMPEPGWLECAMEMLQIAPGLLLAFMVTVVMTAISVAISTRLPMLPNLIICFSIYVLGNLVPILPSTAAGRFPLVLFIADLLSSILPGLDSFNVYGAISTSRGVPFEYLGTTALYCLLYSTVAMLLALLMFEDRDLA